MSPDPVDVTGRWHHLGWPPCLTMLPNRR